MGKRVGILTHPAGVDSELHSTLDLLLNDPRFKVTQLYAPEHGIRGEFPNGLSSPIGVDPSTGLPIEGLFINPKRPSKESLARIDTLIYDVQDIGSRSYTYISTLGEVMKAVAEAGVELMVLDRPNPMGGDYFEGPIRDEKYQSMIGWGPLPIVHGMTIGEVAKFYNDILKINCRLTVVEMQGWKREMRWSDTGLRWVPPSSGIPHAVSALLYSVNALVGGATLNVNDGIGTTLPFELTGAVFKFDPFELATFLNQQNLSGARFRGLFYTTRLDEHKNKILNGVQAFVDDQDSFRPVHTALTIAHTLFTKYPKEIKVGDPKRFGRVWGNDQVLQSLSGSRIKTVAEIEAPWKNQLEDFGEKRRRNLIYP